MPPGLRPRLVRDLHLDAGPLAGIEAGLAASPHEVLVAVACDMPGVTEALARRLVAALDADPALDAAVPRLGGRAEPACAAYRRSAAGPIAAALGQGVRRAADALLELRVQWIEDEDPRQFANLNTPDEYRAFLDRVDRAEAGPGGSGGPNSGTRAY